MTDAPQPPPGWQPPNPPTQPPPPPPTSPTGYPPPPPPATPPGWAAPPTPGGSLPPPPGSPGYGYGYTPVGGQGKPLGGIATALTVLLAVAAAAALLVAVALNNRASVLDDPFGNFEEVQDADDLAIGSSVLYLIVVVATAVLWMIWQYRHAKNAEALGKRDGLGAGWAIGGWFIPVAWWVLPQLQLLQSAKASDPSAPSGQGKAPAALPIWWALWVLQAIISLSSGRFGAGEELNDLSDIDEFRSADQAGSVSALFAAAAAVAAIVLVRQLTQRQHEALRQRGALA